MKSFIFCLNLALIIIPNAQLLANARSIAFEADSLEMQKSESLDTNSRQNKRQFRFGTTFDIGPTFHVFSSRPFLLSDADFNFIGFDSELKFNAFACSYSMFVDYIEGDNVIRGGLGFKADYGTYEWREPTKLFMTNMAGNQVEVNLPIKRELYYSASSFVVGAGFKRRLLGALYGEIAVEASFVLERNFQYREYVSKFFPEEYDGSLPGLQGHFQGIAGISYDIPCQINKETTYIFAPFIRYYYALSSIHTIANWKISRIGFGVEIRF
jgi:hypothetical protein